MTHLGYRISTRTSFVLPIGERSPGVAGNYARCVFLLLLYYCYYSYPYYCVTYSSPLVVCCVSVGTAFCSSYSNTAVIKYSHTCVHTNLLSILLRVVKCGVRVKGSWHKLHTHTHTHTHNLWTGWTPRKSWFFHLLLWHITDISIVTVKMHFFNVTGWSNSNSTRQSEPNICPITREYEL